MRFFVALAACFGATGVAMGAFGAHALDLPTFSEDMETWRTAARYHLVHAVALLGTAEYLTRTDGLETGIGTGAVACWAFTVGIVVFSGSLYLLVLTDTRWLGAITPLGGLAFIVGWLSLGYTALSVS